MKPDIGWNLFDEPIEQSSPIEVPAKEPIVLLLNGKWYSAGKMLWDCTGCLCLDCANSGNSCTDCKGFELCRKIGGKLGGKIWECPDYRKEGT